MSDEKMYCYCFNELKRVPGGYGCDKCRRLFLLMPEELGYRRDLWASLEPFNFDELKKQRPLGLWARLWAKVGGGNAVH